MSIYYQDSQVTLYHGDALTELQAMPEQSVDCIVTSPPYFGLRDYGQDGQLGAEPTPADFVAALVAVFREARRVLADDGTMWLNLGDSYASSVSNNGGYSDKSGLSGFTSPNTKGRRSNDDGERRKLAPGVPPKNLLGIPWRIAFALQDDGWILRNDIIWAKPNAMPESVTDRLSNRHEHLFMFSKSPRYWFDLDPIREPSEPKPGASNSRPKCVEAWTHGTGLTPHNGTRIPHELGRNPGDVWAIPTQPFPGAHFATFPLALPERAIQAGCKPIRDKCDCDETIKTPIGTGERAPDPTLRNGRSGMSRPRRDTEGTTPITRREQRHHAKQIRDSPHREEIENTCGPAFAHYIRTDRSGARPLPPHLIREFTSKGWLTDAPPCTHRAGGPGVVLDPFSGSGTTGLAAARHGRRYIGIDLSRGYLDLSLKTRLAQSTLDFTALEAS